MNTAVRQIREALGDDAETPIFVETVPKRGYRFIAPVDAGPQAPTPLYPRGTDLNLHKALWLNIAELRLARGQATEAAPATFTSPRSSPA